MSSGDIPESASGAKAKSPLATARESDVTRLLRASRQREFAMLREHMYAGQNSSNVLAGLRHRAVRDKSATVHALEKIERIGAHLENLWNPPLEKAKAPPAPAALPDQSALHAVEPPAVEPASTPAPTVTPVTGESLPEALLLTVPEISYMSAESNELSWTTDPKLQEAARLCLNGQELAAQTLLQSTLDPLSERTRLAFHQALMLLEVCRLLGDMATFDDVVMEFVHWWNGLPPHWEPIEAPMASATLRLRGDLRGHASVELPELAASDNNSKLAIDCNGLWRLDQPAASALLAWLRKAQAGNYTIRLETGSVLVYLQWTITGIEKFANLRKTF
jgi:ABC-type transporter Mla MlaB component